ncbi:hypothetical protein [Aureivirga sp. CE67]|uniref:hypothetical protein n=1 Tax=Aureivirga sp. CE67 TaxID=1788983 RepID=UPI0018C9C58C|nr:hypothetical protein [Aureivirga sp. CE67]
MIDKSINGGVSAQTGFALQRNTALYLLLEFYEEKFKDKNYFLCLEHYDDFLFCFLSEKNEIELIEAYQSKKKSPDIWKLDKELFNILKKLLKTGEALNKDEIIKSKDYRHLLFFSSNQITQLKLKKNKVPYSVSIKEDNYLVEYNYLPTPIKERIIKGINDESLNKQFDYLHFIWIDLNRTVDKQINELVGQLDKVFGEKINNPRAAVMALLEMFNELEVIFNQGNVVKLLDNSKRITSEQIEKTFKILTTKSKCFDYWRKHESQVSQILKVKPYEREEFELTFNSSFDFFKSMKQVEHRDILEFTRLNYKKCKKYKEEEIVLELIEMFYENCSSLLDKDKVKAIFFAAYFETIYKKN